MSDAPPPPDVSIEAFKAMVAEMERDPDAVRAAMPPSPTTAELVARFPGLADVAVVQSDITVVQSDIATSAAVVPARLYTPTDRAPIAGFVWVHGGAFVFGDLDMPEANWVGLALASRGISTLSVDYRKAVGRDRFPAASDDVLAAWTWALANADRFGVPATALQLGGASAGGNLVAGVTKRLRDGAGPMPRSLVLVYPATHAVIPPTTPAIAEAFTRMPAAVRFPPAITEYISLQYAGSAASLDDPYAFPANGDVAGQPPVFVLNAEADDLRASGEVYAAKLRDAGVDVEMVFEPGTGHGHLNEPDLDAAWRSIDRLVDWLTRRG